MVSKTSDDLPDPDRPVMTTSRWRGMSTSMFLRLWTRAPRTEIQLCAMILRLLEPPLLARPSVRRQHVHPRRILVWQAADLIERSQVLGRQDHIDRLQIVVELGEFPRADDDARHGIL